MQKVISFLICMPRSSEDMHCTDCYELEWAMLVLKGYVSFVEMVTLMDGQKP